MYPHHQYVLKFALISPSPPYYSSFSPLHVTITVRMERSCEAELLEASLEAAWRHTDTLIYQSRYQEILQLVQDDPLEDLMTVRTESLLRAQCRRVDTKGAFAAFRDFLAIFSGECASVVAAGNQHQI